MTVSDRVALASEEGVGKGHATKNDVLNRGFLVGHKDSGAHETLDGEFTNDEGTTLAANVLVKINSAERSYQKTVAGDEGAFGYYGVTTSSTAVGAKDRIVTGHYAVVDWDNVGSPSIGVSRVTPSATAGQVKLASEGDFEIGLVVLTAGLTNQLGVWLFGWRPDPRPPMPRSYLAGLGLSNNAVDPDHDIDIAVGEARSDDDAEDIKLSSALTKQIDAAWAEGNNAGGLDTGTVAADAWYHLFVILNPSSRTVDVLFSLSISSPTMPSGYTKKRRIGSVLTDSVANIIAFTQLGDEFLWRDPPLDVNLTSTGTFGVTAALSVPGGIKVWASINARTFKSNGNPVNYISPLDVNDEAPDFNAAPLGSLLAHPQASTEIYKVPKIRTNTLGQIRFRSSSDAEFSIVTLGWVDRRGRGD